VIAKTEVPTNEHAAATARVWGDVPDDEQRERPAAGDLVGRRGEVEEQAGGEAEDHPVLGAVRKTRGHDDEQHEVGDDAVPRPVREDRHLEHQGQRDGEGGDQVTTPGEPHFQLPSASMTLRSLSLPDGTTTPTTSSALKSTYGVITARWVVSRGLE